MIGEMNVVSRVRKSIDDRNRVIQELYADPALHKVLVGTLVRMGCTQEKAQDYKTDAIVTFVKLCYKPDFIITSNLNNYITGIAKNLWRSGVTKQDIAPTLKSIHHKSDIPSHEEVIISAETKVLLDNLINQLDPICYKVLTLWSHNHRMKKIAAELSYKSEGMARKKKHQCLKRLYEIVHQNKEVSEQIKSML